MQQKIVIPSQDAAYNQAVKEAILGKGWELAQPQLNDIDNLIEQSILTITKDLVKAYPHLLWEYFEVFFEGATALNEASNLLITNKDKSIKLTANEAAYLFSRYIYRHYPPTAFEVQGWVEHLYRYCNKPPTLEENIQAW